jgi:hypothetical protein
VLLTKVIADVEETIKANNTAELLSEGNRIIRDLIVLKEDMEQDRPLRYSLLPSILTLVLSSTTSNRISRLIMRNSVGWVVSHGTMFHGSILNAISTGTSPLSITINFSQSSPRDICLYNLLAALRSFLPPKRRSIQIIQEWRARTSGKIPRILHDRRRTFLSGATEISFCTHRISESC